MTLLRAIAAASGVAGLMAAGAIAFTIPAAAQQYYGGYERAERGFDIEPDPYARPRYRRYNRWQDEQFDDEPTYRRPSWRERYRNRRNRDRWAEPGVPDLRDWRGRRIWNGERWADPADDEDDRDVRDSQRSRRDFTDDQDAGTGSDEVRSGGERPDIGAKAPPIVNVRLGFAPGSIVIDQSQRKLYYVITPTTAYRYAISVGREGFSWTGVEKVSRIADWPDWYPPEEMRERDPKLPKKMTGGIDNPLGVKAIYLGNTLYRIHGTNNPKSIGQAASSGCFRMLNAHVLHLAEIVEVGAEVHVLKQLPRTVAEAR